MYQTENGRNVNVLHAAAFELGFVPSAKSCQFDQAGRVSSTYKGVRPPRGHWHILSRLKTFLGR